MGRIRTVGLRVAVLIVLSAGGEALAAGPEVVVAPLPSSAVMGAALLGGLAAFARFPTGKRQHRRHRVNS